jgi:uncharacterized protein
MLLPCEVGVKTVLPAIKAIMARIIVEKHQINENQTAKILGLSQSAVSRYVTRDRGNLIEIENTAEIQSIVDQMVNFLIKEPEKKMEVMNLFCQACMKIREKGLMCGLCQKDMPKEWAENCTFCH